MKAPDKIYLQRVPSNQEVIDEWTVEPVKHTVLEDIEYIRKDALLEFLTGLEKDSARNAGTNDLAYAAHEMVCELIDKIKSL